MSVSNFKSAEDFSVMLVALKNKDGNELINDKLELKEKPTGRLAGFLKVIFLPLTKLNIGPFAHYRVDNVAKAILNEMMIHKASLKQADFDAVDAILVNLNTKTEQKYEYTIFKVRGTYVEVMEQKDKFASVVGQMNNQFAQKLQFKNQFNAVLKDISRAAENRENKIKYKESRALHKNDPIKPDTFFIKEEVVEVKEEVELKEVVEVKKEGGFFGFFARNVETKKIVETKKLVPTTKVTFKMPSNLMTNLKAREYYNPIEESIKVATNFYAKAKKNL